MWENITEYIKIPDLKHGWAYKIYARNGAVGIWRADKKGFELARTKFGHTFIDIEYHWDADPTYGTAKPYEEIEDAPDLAQEDLIVYLKEKEQKFRY